nr:uncharacterized protein LOC127348690 [Lolium perenne]
MHLPRLLTDLVINVADLIPHSGDFSRHTADHVMSAYADAIRWFLSAPAKQRSIKTLRLAFYLIDPYLRSIGDAVAETGGAERLEFAIRAHLYPINRVRDVQDAVFARRLVAFVAACPVAFGWLTRLTLQNISFSDSEMLHLLNACNRLELLSLIRCCAVSNSRCSILRIDAPRSPLLALEIRESFYPGVELTSLPKLERVFCDDRLDIFIGVFPVRFGNVPRLHHINLAAPHLMYYSYRNPGQHFPALSNLRVIHLSDLDIQEMFWTLHILHGAPLLNTLSLKVFSPRCYLTNVVEEAPDFEHLNLSLLEIKGFAGLTADFEVVRYIRIIMERAVYLKKIHLVEQHPFLRSCGGVSCSRCQVIEQQTNLLSKLFADAGRAPEIAIDLMSGDTSF